MGLSQYQEEIAQDLPSPGACAAYAEGPYDEDWQEDGEDEAGDDELPPEYEAIVLEAAEIIADAIRLQEAAARSAVPEDAAADAAEPDARAAEEDAAMDDVVAVEPAPQSAVREDEVIPAAEAGKAARPAGRGKPGPARSGRKAG